MREGGCRYVAGVGEAGCCEREEEEEGGEMHFVASWWV